MKWYYSAQLNLYISLEPLKISAPVFEIAGRRNIPLEWDDYGNLVMLEFAELKAIVKDLNGVILSPTEYWLLYREAVETDNEELFASLTSPQFTEILDRVYVADDTYIDHCEIIGQYKYAGREIQCKPVVGRPGWISYADIDEATGHPIQVHAKTTDKAQMKYWSPDLANTEVKKTIAIRGFVTSVAMPSLDLGIPVDTRQPKMMVRFCTRNKPREFLTEEERNAFETVMESGDLAEMEVFAKTNIFAKLEASRDTQTGILRERFYSMLGRLRVSAEYAGKRTTGRQLLTFRGFWEYIRNNKQLLNKALEGGHMLTLVAGHANPDTDTVISSVFEAYRLHMTNKDMLSVYLPLILSDAMPGEIAYILGEEISDALLYANRLSLQEWMNSGRVRFVFTDQNYRKEYQKYVISITDHHKLNAELTEGVLDIPCELEEVGSCTSLIVRKYIGQGYDFDRDLSKLLYAAMLMDTENRVAHKMTPWDVQIMDLFKEKAGVESDEDVYQDIMNCLIGETDGGRLYRRDYKHYTGFGFSVLKVKGLSEKPDFDKWMEEVLALAKEDNERYHDYFTLVKLVDYREGGLEVKCERIYWVWNDVENILCQKVLELLVKIITLCLPGSEIVLTEQYMQIVGTGKQISRKKIVPAIVCLLKYYGQYIYIKPLNKWVARDFLKMNDTLREHIEAKRADEKGRICNISFIEVQNLLTQVDLKMLSLREYWIVYEEASRLHDIALLESLTSSEFLEFLDTCSVDGTLLHHPLFQGNTAVGESAVREILYANPGLISPEFIDAATGLPNHIFSAANYHDKSLWRYWSPMEDKTYVFARTYIFLLQQPCLDAKVTPGECFANMGIRPVRERNLQVDVEIIIQDTRLVMRYKSEYDNSYVTVYEEDFFI